MVYLSFNVLIILCSEFRKPSEGWSLVEEARSAAACHLERAFCGLVLSSVLIGSRCTWRILNVQLCVLVLSAQLLAHFWVMISVVVTLHRAARISSHSLPSCFWPFVSHFALLALLLFSLVFNQGQISTFKMLSFLSGNIYWPSNTLICNLFLHAKSICNCLVAGGHLGPCL